MITIRIGDPIRFIHFRNLHTKFFGVLDTHLNIPHSGQILIHLTFVRSIEAAVKTLRVINHEIQNAFLFRTAHFIVIRIPRAEELFENHTGIALCGSGGIFAPPRQIELVSTRVARIAIS